MLGKYVTRKQSMFRLQLVLNGCSDLINCNLNLLIKQTCTEKRSSIMHLFYSLYNDLSSLNKIKCVLNRTMEKIGKITNLYIYDFNFNFLVHMLFKFSLLVIISNN